MERAKVTVAAAAIGMAFDFGTSNVGKVQVRSIERVSYFVKHHAWPPGPKTMPIPWADEAMVFKDLFTTGLRMHSHLMLTNILQKIHVLLHQLTLNVILHIGKFI
jgi:hypothetical protein